MHILYIGLFYMGFISSTSFGAATTGKTSYPQKNVLIFCTNNNIIFDDEQKYIESYFILWTINIHKSVCKNFLILIFNKFIRILGIVTADVWRNASKFNSWLFLFYFIKYQNTIKKSRINIVVILWCWFLFNFFLGF